MTQSTNYTECIRKYDIFSENLLDCVHSVESVNWF